MYKRFDVKSIDEPDKQAKEMLKFLLFYNKDDSLLTSARKTMPRSAYDRIFKVDGMIKLGPDSKICMFDLKTSLSDTYDGISFTVINKGRKVFEDHLPDFYIFITKFDVHHAYCIVPHKLEEYINEHHKQLRHSNNENNSLYIILSPRELNELSSIVFSDREEIDVPGRSVNEILEWASNNPNPIRKDLRYGGIEIIYKTLEYL